MSKTSFLRKVNTNKDLFYVAHEGIEKNFPIHSHNKHQLYYLEGGAAYFNTPRKSFFVPANHFLWIPAGLEHNIIFRTKAKMVHNIYIPTILKTSNPSLETNAGIYPVTNLLAEMINYTLSWKGEIGNDDQEKFQFLITLNNVIASAANLPLPIALPTTNNESLSEIVKYIHRNIDQPLSLDYIAEKFSYSTRTLSRLFQNNLNTSFLQYVKLTRIIKAMELLLQTDLSISEITFKCGYNNLSSFSYVFHKTVNISPADFRKKTKSK
ncbi:helix-turn-helix domain-containing protein [Plebeiibacterium sediminum]|uniref:AraC family transcriptional regulator n=1 Tax=Plebeiibacterium sediminum TaxID=2992112 RepID=A0AAE3SHL5_9BACT|nr:AraC family transcriptional regulator [Plebeiobacterium sediminum]MCW3789748.1 AraC family transcriptional regulator [Plebeiobacterium sediminum]